MRAFITAVFFVFVLVAVYFIVPYPTSASVPNEGSGTQCANNSQCKTGEHCSLSTGGVCVPNSSSQVHPTDAECTNAGGTCIRRGTCTRSYVDDGTLCASSQNYCCMNPTVCTGPNNAAFTCPAGTVYYCNGCTEVRDYTAGPGGEYYCSIDPAHIYTSGTSSNTCMYIPGIKVDRSTVPGTLYGPTLCPSGQHLNCAPVQSVQCVPNIGQVSCDTGGPLGGGPGGTSPRYEISGLVFKDNITINGRRDAGEPIYQGASIRLTGSFSTDRTDVSDSAGKYDFTNLRRGTYTARLTVPAGYKNTTTISRTYGFPPNRRNVDFGISPIYTVTGNVFIDLNSNGIKDAGEPNYTAGGINITANSGSVAINQGAGTYTAGNLFAGTYKISYAALPTNYQMSAPINGPPPSFNVTVGPSCSVAGSSSTGASCSGSNIINLNFAIKQFPTWVQTYGLDLRFDDGYTNLIPPSPTYPAYASVVDNVPGGTAVTPPAPGMINSGTIPVTNSTGTTVTVAPSTRYKIIVANFFFFNDTSGSIVRGDPQWKTPTNSNTYSIHNNSIAFNGVQLSSSDFTTAANTTTRRYTFYWTSGASTTSLKMNLVDSNYSDNSIGTNPLSFELYPDTYAACGDASAPVGTVVSQGTGASASIVYQNNTSLYGPQNAIDGVYSRTTHWAAGTFPTQWIELNLGRQQTVNGLKLHVRQIPGGRTVHQIYTGNSPNPGTLSRTLDCQTEDYESINVVFSPPLSNTQYIRINTTTSPSWVAWTEIEAYGPGGLAQFTTPGIIFIGDGTANFGSGQPSTTGWLVGGTTYPEVFSQTSITPATSYQYLLDKATQAKITVTDMSTLSTCTNLANCTLPANLANGVYKANGNVILNGYTFPNSKDYVFLINGDLTIKGNIITPPGSVAIFSSSNDIIVDRTVGATSNTYPLPTAQIQAIFSANRNFTVDGINNCGSAADKMLVTEGAIVTNAATETAGTFKNFRDLCGSNATIPAFVIRQRLDFLLNAPTFIFKRNTIFREDTP